MANRAHEHATGTQCCQRACLLPFARCAPNSLLYGFMNVWSSFRSVSLVVLAKQEGLAACGLVTSGRSARSASPAHPRPRRRGAWRCPLDHNPRPCAQRLYQCAGSCAGCRRSILLEVCLLVAGSWYSKGLVQSLELLQSVDGRIQMRHRQECSQVLPRYNSARTQGNKRAVREHMACIHLQGVDYKAKDGSTGCRGGWFQAAHVPLYKLP